MYPIPEELVHLVKGLTFTSVILIFKMDRKKSLCVHKTSYKIIIIQVVEKSGMS